MLLLVIVLASACTVPQGEKSVDSGKGYIVKTIDSCEYIEVSSCLGCQHGYYSLTHKGNCKNPVHTCADVTKPQQPLREQGDGK